MVHLREPQNGERLITFVIPRADGKFNFYDEVVTDREVLRKETGSIIAYNPLPGGRMECEVTVGEMRDMLFKGAQKYSKPGGADLPFDHQPRDLVKELETQQEMIDHARRYPSPLVPVSGLPVR